MRRLLYVAAGFVGGVVVARNAAPMPTPVVGAIVLGVAGLLVLAWWAGQRDKHAAVAVAVAKATAVASAQAEARAAAVAQAAVNLYLGTAGEGPTGQIAASSLLPTRLAGRHVAGELVEQASGAEDWSTVMQGTAVREPQMT